MFLLQLSLALNWDGVRGPLALGCAMALGKCKSESLAGWDVFSCSPEEGHPYRASGGACLSLWPCGDTLGPASLCKAPQQGTLL